MKFDPAQRMDGNLGKVLHLTADGRPVPGNPWTAKGGIAAQFWDMGHRNVLGLAFAPDGRLSRQSQREERGDGIGQPSCHDRKRGDHDDGNTDA